MPFSRSNPDVADFDKIFTCALRGFFSRRGLTSSAAGCRIPDGVDVSRAHPREFSDGARPPRGRPIGPRHPVCRGRIFRDDTAGIIPERDPSDWPGSMSIPFCFSSKIMSSS
jgi:hypothetical protein